ncbi:response regulator [Paenibacillus cymbidii]|uniref:response regulator n=1 Tax=Paenibacillus cymbidii TaxID=1639034 RepID=UPI00108118FA|nr:response regulator [Paenibacillus cymbidii]
MENRPLRVLVADDEFPLREELKSLSWDAFGAVLIGEAKNGEEALQFCHDYLPDVVITDITMPSMDGITLLREIKKRFPLMQVILLTCHSDFVYAREALQLGALDYFLKVTLDENDLAMALHKARLSIERERSHQKDAKDKMRWVHSKALGRLLKKESFDPDAVMQQLFAVWPKLALPFRFARLQVDANASEHIFVNQEINSALIQLEQVTPGTFTWVPLGSKEYLLFVHDDSASVETFVDFMEMVLSVLRDALAKQLPFIAEEVVIDGAISDEVRTPDQFVDALAMARAWEHTSFYEADKHGKVYVGQPPAPAHLTEAVVTELTDKMRGVNWNQERLVAFFRGPFTALCTERRFDPGQLRQLVSNWTIEWRQENGRNGTELLLHRIAQANSFYQIVSDLIHYAEERSGKKERYRTEVNDALKLIKHNLAAGLTLSGIAGQVGLSAHYLGRLFREELGESFNGYVTRSRLEFALELLKTTNLKVYEVAERVGIPSYRYFSVMFRNWTGFSPTDYKKNLR